MQLGYFTDYNYPIPGRAILFWVHTGMDFLFIITAFITKQQIISNSQQPVVTELLSIQLKLLEDISGVQGALQGQTPGAGTPASPRSWTS